MLITRTRLGILVILLLLIAAGSVGAPAGATQVATWCDADSATPNEALASAGLGLTHSELDALYGPGVAAGEYWFYERDGYSLGLSDCNLEVNVDPDGPYAERDAAERLVRELLPEDAVLGGGWRFGSFMTTVTEVEEWTSTDLAARYRELGETRTGSILVMYTYTHMGVEDDRVTLVQMGTAAIPQ